MIYGYVGTPGSGKTYEAVMCILENLKMGRVIYTNIDGLEMPICRQSVSVLSEYVEKRLDPRDRTYYWQGADRQSFGKDLQVDGVALAQNFISVTPVKCDMTDYPSMENLAGWELDAWVEELK